MKQSLANSIHPEIAADTCPVQIEGFELEKIPCCYLLRHKQDNRIVKLNQTGLMIWQICNGEWSVGEMIEVLQESYPQDAENIPKDIYRTLDLLRDEEVVSY